jgi:lipopolysaccharide/colanic/teichoic acid biosynthesis glycosyltransferase
MAKRCLDLLVAVSALVALAPLLLAVAVLVKLDSRGPVLYRATRAGKDGVPFAMYKFRTMKIGASITGPGITRRGDGRITRLGRVLRATKIDEVPQFVNVLKGEMSLIGPRPEDPRFVARYTCEQRRVLSVRPGMAGPAALALRSEETVLAEAGGDVEAIYLNLILPAKLLIDLEYVNHQSFLGDLHVLAEVPLALARPRNLVYLNPQLFANESEQRHTSGTTHAA